MTDLNVLIQRKINSQNPCYGTSTRQVLTDYDVFPYQRWWKGRTNADFPIIADRVAGYRKINNGCYVNICKKNNKPSSYPDHCFQYPCTTVKPCFVNNLLP